MRNTRGIYLYVRKKCAASCGKGVKILCAALCLSLGLSAAPASLSAGFLLEAEAHCGRTYANSGHCDNYHYYCGGYPAHLHTNGVCPYAGGTNGTSSTNQNMGSHHTEAASCTPQETTAPDTTLGWHHNDHGWWYNDSKNTCKKNGCFLIDGHYYLFNDDGYMLTGWQNRNGSWYYYDSDGAMVTGDAIIDGQPYHFGPDGVLVEDYYDAPDTNTGHHHHGEAH